MDYLKELEKQLPELRRKCLIRFDADTISIPYATKGTVEDDVEDRTEGG
ncbi:hypothetical protein RFF05_04975 [Bengtsoniella intestinalis]